MFDIKAKMYHDIYEANTIEELISFCENHFTNPFEPFDIYYKDVTYWINWEYIKEDENYHKPFVSYYFTPDCSDEHIQYFNSFEELFKNYKLQDGTMLYDLLTKVNF